MNKKTIRVIKRKDTEAATANNKTQVLSEPKPAAAANGKNIERRLHRKMADTVSSWVAERKENNRVKDISAIRELFGDETLLSRTA